jgi:hypothetical protein
MKKRLILVAVVICSIACNSSGTKENALGGRKEYFKDINLLALEGVGKIHDTATYPYIEIEQINDTGRNITYHGVQGISEHREYRKEKDYWVASATSNGDTCTILTYEYILPHQLIELHYNYNSTTDTALEQVRVLEGARQTVYYLGNAKGLLPGVHVPDIVKKKNKGIFTQEISVKNNVLRIQESENGSALAGTTRCYEIGDHSYFWWRYFGWTTKQISCE